MSPPNQKSIFPQKLWRLVNDEQLYHAICWSEDGRSFHVYEQSLKILCLGKENNIFYTRQPKSFVRQLHLYGFRKVNKNQFMHPFFVRGQPELIKKIKRSYKSPNSSTSSETSDKACANENMIKIKSTICEDRQNYPIDQFNTNSISVPESQSTVENQLDTCNNNNNSRKFVKILSEEQNYNNGQQVAETSIGQQQVLHSVKTEIIDNQSEWYETSYTDISFNYYEDNMLTMYNNEVYPTTFDEI